jgi:hypothetical protein
MKDGTNGVVNYLQSEMKNPRKNQTHYFVTNNQSYDL